MHNFVHDDLVIASLEKQIATIWRARFLIAACAIVAAFVGYSAALVLPKMRDTWSLFGPNHLPNLPNSPVLCANLFRP